MNSTSPPTFVVDVVVIVTQHVVAHVSAVRDCVQNNTNNPPRPQLSSRPSRSHIHSHIRVYSIYTYVYVIHSHKHHINTRINTGAMALRCDVNKRPKRETEPRGKQYYAGRPLAHQLAAALLLLSARVRALFSVYLSSEHGERSNRHPGRHAVQHARAHKKMLAGSLNIFQSKFLSL